MKDALTEIADLKAALAECSASRDGWHEIACKTARELYDARKALQAAERDRDHWHETACQEARESRRVLEAVQRDANIALEQRRAAEAHAVEWRARCKIAEAGGATVGGWIVDASTDDWACG